MITYLQALNRLAKWRAVFASKWLGTRTASDPECQSVRDVYEQLLIQRVEITALVTILARRAPNYQHFLDEFQHQVTIECAEKNAQLERQFPGFRVSDDGVHIETALAAETMKGWPQ